MLRLLIRFRCRPNPTKNEGMFFVLDTLSKIEKLLVEALSSNLFSLYSPHDVSIESNEAIDVYGSEVRPTLTELRPAFGSEALN